MYPHSNVSEVLLTLRQAFTAAVYNLAVYSEYIVPLREEIEEAVRSEGWTKAGMGKLYKLDSFVKESARMTGQGICTYQGSLL
jgi:hypothetical protein